MSFNFEWPTFSAEFYANAVETLSTALNRGQKPKAIVDDIIVQALHMGSVPPELEILEIGDLSRDRFRGIFRFVYAGDAHLEISTRVQANPLARSAGALGALASTASRSMLFATIPLTVPMRVRLSDIRLRAIVVLVVSRTKGITLVFKNDPLESVKVSSTFDSVNVIQKYLQEEIEGQMREMFREDLPTIIHKLSQEWIASGHSEPAARDGLPEPASPPKARRASWTHDGDAPDMAASLHRDARRDTSSAPGTPRTAQRANVAAHLAELLRANHTLSPYTPNPRLVTLRASLAPRQRARRVQAQQKRTFHVSL